MVDSRAVDSLVRTLLYASFAGAASAGSGSCSSDNPEPYLNFSTKTPYSAVHNTDAREDVQPGCRSVQIWLSARHGTRYPGDDDIVLMSRRLPQIRDAVLSSVASGEGELCSKDLDLLRKWKLLFDVSVENNLTPSGEEELFGIAERMQKRFPHLLGAPYNPASHRFLTTAKQRAIESGRHFARGLFGDQTVQFPKPQVPDPLLQFYKTCYKWKRLVDDSEDARRERYAFQNSSHMLDVIAGVSRRLGLSENVTYSDLKLMYDACRYDKTLRPVHVSPWCAAFSTSDLVVLEFDMDLEYYWTDSYGFAINYEQACPQVRDFIEKFEQMRGGDDARASQPLAHLYFSHLGGVLKLITRLGLFNESQPLRHTDFARGRRFKSSRLASFASNVALVLYRCDDGDYRVQCFLQEHPILLPGCSRLLCSMENVVSQYRDVVDQCDVDAMCNDGEGWLQSLWNGLVSGLPGLILL